MSHIRAYLKVWFIQKNHITVNEFLSQKGFCSKFNIWHHIVKVYYIENTFNIGHLKLRQNASNHQREAEQALHVTLFPSDLCVHLMNLSQIFISFFGSTTS